MWSMMLMAWAAPEAQEQIPFVKLRSAAWDIVIRTTAKDRARVERVRARCDGEWIDVCARDVAPAQRKSALPHAFREGVRLTGSFSYCSTAVIRDLPEDLARQLVVPDPAAFCAAMGTPVPAGSSAGEAEPDLVNRLMGGRDTTSGSIRMKPPPGADRRRSATPALTSPTEGPSTAPASIDAATAPAAAGPPAATEPAPPGTATPEPPGLDVPEPAPPGTATPEPPATAAPGAAPQAPPEATKPEAPTAGAATPEAAPEGIPTPEPTIDEDLAIEQTEVDALERLSPPGTEDPGKADGAPVLSEETEEDLRNYRIIDIESLPED